MAKIKDVSRNYGTNKTSTRSKVKDAAKKAIDFTIENTGKRGLLSVLIVIGLIILAIGLFSVALNNIDLNDLKQMNNLGLLTGIEYNFRLNENSKAIAINTLVAQVGAILTAVFLIIAAVSPISGKGSPYFNDYVRLGLIAFAAVMVYVAVIM